MTIVGKLLVFLNLIFSIIVGVLVAVVYLTASGSAEENRKLQKSLEVSKASEGATRSMNKTLLEEKGRLATELQNKGVKETDPIAYVIDNVLVQNTSLKADNEAMKKRLDQANASVLEKDAELEKAKAYVQGAQSELKRRQDDYEKLRVTLFAEQANSTELVKAKNDAERGAAQAGIERNNALQRATDLEKDNERLAQELVRLQTKGSQPVASTLLPNGKNPPTALVKGKVTRVEDGFIVLNVGSDSGLKEGNTLEVFRLNPSRYLGTMRITKTEPYTAVGQMMARSNGAAGDPIRVGDEVAPTTSSSR